MSKSKGLSAEKYFEMLTIIKSLERELRHVIKFDENGQHNLSGIVHPQCIGQQVDLIEHANHRLRELSHSE